MRYALTSPRMGQVRRAVHTRVEVKPRHAARRVVPLGYAPFDTRFGACTDAPQGPRAVISRKLADAHVDHEVPLWEVRGQLLTCHVGGLIQVQDLDNAVLRALRVADLLAA